MISLAARARRAMARVSGARVRTEAWGGIVHLRRPAALVYVDRDLLRRLGHGEDPLWSDPAPAHRLHRAPVELHWTLSRRCDQRCAHCYTNSLPQAPPFDPASLEPLADALARAGVFHVALGGGEPLAEPHILDVARALRARGILPSTTTSGAPVTPELVRKLSDFAQINVSIDAVGPAYATARGHDRFAMAKAALVRLREAGVRTGINAVLTRHTFEALEDLVTFARRRRVAELELLRLKPTGRGRATYLDDRLTPEQGERLLPLVLGLARRHRVRLKLDCSLAPFVYHHRPDPRVLRFFRIHGCEAGDSLGSLDPEGRLSGCSFLAPVPGDATRLLTEDWTRDPHLDRLRRYRDDAPAPCDTCPALPLCNGGCRAVSAFLTGNPHTPDPECPRVRAVSLSAGVGGQTNAR